MEKKDTIEEKDEEHSFVDMSENASRAIIEFNATKTAVLEGEGRVRVGIRRYGKTNCRVLFKYV